jgi:putative phosphoribosyl transferase
VLFRDRADAGKKLAAVMKDAAAGWREPLLLALPRGGIEVGVEISRALHIPITVFIVRKLGAPNNPEYAIGAVAEGGGMVLSPGWRPNDPYVLEAVQREQERIARYAALYRGDAPLPPLEGRTLVLVDDGAATGATMKAALKALRAVESNKPAKLIAALPVAPPQTAAELRGLADEVFLLHSPDAFYAVSQFYGSFTDLPDDRLRDLLKSAVAEEG